jgi:rubrerythrin
MAVAKFQRQLGGTSTVYTCGSCGKRTRQVEDEPHGVCLKCYTEGGFENEHSDSGGDHFGKGSQPDVCPACRGEGWAATK